MSSVPQFDFFLSHSAEDEQLAHRLAGALAEQGLQIFFDTAKVRLGARWDHVVADAIESSAGAIVLFSADPKSLFAREEIAEILEHTRSNSEYLVIPVLLGEDEPSDLPYGLQIRNAIRFRSAPNAAQVQEATERIIEAIRTNRARPPVDRDPSLLNLAVRFFEAAGRAPSVDSERRSSGLRVPEPVEIVYEEDSRDKINSLASSMGARFHTPLAARLGYLVHRGDLPEPAMETLNTLRVQGIFIVPLSEGVLQASLYDGNARATLHALSQEGLGGDNLFRTYNALIDRRFLFGRSELLARIGSALGRGEQILLTGTRKSGKTSFINILRQDLKAHPVAFIDLQKYDRASPSWTEAFFAEIVEAFDRWGRSEVASWKTGMSPGGNAHGFEESIRQRRAWQEAHGSTSRLIVILDELERLMPRRGEQTVGKEFIRAAGALRALAQASDRPISIIAADLRTAANRKNVLEDVGTNPFFQFFQETPLQLLTPKAVCEMIRTLGRMSGVLRVDDDYLDELYRLSGGHPWVARTLASGSYESRANSETLSKADLEAGILALEDDDVLGSFFQGNFWAALSEQERNCISDAANRTTLHPVDAATKASLKHQGLLADGRLPIGAFAQWVRRTQGSVER